MCTVYGCMKYKRDMRGNTNEKFGGYDRRFHLEKDAVLFNPVDSGESVSAVI